MRAGGLRGLTSRLLRTPRRRRGVVLAIVAVAASTGVPVLIAGSTSVFTRLATLPLWVIAGAPLLMVAGWGANAGRVAILARANGRRLPFRHAWLVAAGGDFGAALGPGGLTGIAAYIFLLARSGLGSAAATALFALERLLDQLVFAAALAASAAALALGSQHAHPWRLFGIAATLCAGLVFVILVALAQYRRLVRASAWTLARLRIGARRRWRFIRWSFLFRRGLGEVAALPKGRLALIALCAAGYWAARFAILPLIAAGMHAPVPWGYLLAVQVIALFAGQLSLLPGGTITVEAVFAGLLLPFLHRQDLGLMLLVWRGSVFYFTLVAGGASFALATARGPAGAPVPRASQRTT